MAKAGDASVPARLGPSEWEFEVWTLWCHSLSPSIHLPFAEETHPSENRREIREHLIKSQDDQAATK